MELNIKKIKNIEDYTTGDAEKTALASSAFVNGAISLCTFSKNLKDNNDNILADLKKQIKEKENIESELTTNLYNGFYEEDKRKVL